MPSYNVVFILVTFFFTCCCGAAEPLSAGEERFLQNHWNSQTIPLQGVPPSDYSDLEVSLQPEQCGQCHYQQFQDWQSSIHARAMGPGVKGQLISLARTDPAGARLCWLCHTPLAEQQPVLLPENAQDWQSNKAFSEKLQSHGLVCAACHVRNHKRFGPPPRADRSRRGPQQAPELPHGGYVAESAFLKSAFCKGCHQFAEDDYALNGKLIENTYNEWLTSVYAEKGVQCQDCHMPDSRHLWRGIHDVDMVRKAISLETHLPADSLREGDDLQARIRLTNTGAGHHFPTYITPKVVVRAEMLDDSQAVIADTQQEAYIGREVAMDLSAELYDTRIPANDFTEVVYAQPLAAGARFLKVEVVVYPDHFYERFYRTTLQSDLSAEERRLLEQAWNNSVQSRFTLFEKTLALPTATGGGTATFNHHEQTDKAEIDWNDRQIDWFSYESGLREAVRTNKPVLILFYAPWCPTCHAYRNIFYRQDITAATADFVMVRVNVDRSPQLNQRYLLDGDYVPRVMVANAKGVVNAGIYGGSGGFRYFMSAAEPEAFLDLMAAAISAFPIKP